MFLLRHGHSVMAIPAGEPVYTETELRLNCFQAKMFAHKVSFLFPKA